MKKTTIFLFIVALTFCCTAKETMSQTKNNNENQKVTVAKETDTNNSEKIADTVTAAVPADREVTFNLERLSKLASLSVSGKSKYRGDGLVVLEVTVDETGVVRSMIVRESTNPKLNKPAVDMVRNYAKRFKLQPAIKDGKPVQQEGIFLPIIFDMSLFDDNKNR